MYSHWADKWIVQHKNRHVMKRDTEDIEIGMGIYRYGMMFLSYKFNEKDYQEG
jgi:hypothetical protein